MAVSPRPRRALSAREHALPDGRPAWTCGARTTGSAAPSGSTGARRAISMRWPCRARRILSAARHAHRSLAAAARPYRRLAVALAGAGGGRRSGARAAGAARLPGLTGAARAAVPARPRRGAAVGGEQRDPGGPPQRRRSVDPKGRVLLPHRSHRPPLGRDRSRQAADDPIPPGREPPRLLLGARAAARFRGRGPRDPPVAQGRAAPRRLSRLDAQDRAGDRAPRALPPGRCRRCFTCGASPSTNGERRAVPGLARGGARSRDDLVVHRRRRGAVPGVPDLHAPAPRDVARRGARVQPGAHRAELRRAGDRRSPLRGAPAALVLVPARLELSHPRGVGAARRDGRRRRRRARSCCCGSRRFPATSR